MNEGPVPEEPPPEFDPGPVPDEPPPEKRFQVSARVNLEFNGVPTGRVLFWDTNRVGLLTEMNDQNIKVLLNTLNNWPTYLQTFAILRELCRDTRHGSAKLLGRRVLDALEDNDKIVQHEFAAPMVEYAPPDLAPPPPPSGLLFPGHPDWRGIS